MSFGRTGSAVLRRAKQLAADGNVDEAVNVLVTIGATEHAAAVLMRAKRPAEAGNLLMDSLGLHGIDELRLQEQIPTLRPAQKERALKAAICFSRAREIDRAVAIYVALGETRRASELLSRKGQHARAARLTVGAEGARPDVDPTGPARALEIQEEELAAARELEAEGKEAVAIQHYLRLGKLAEAARVAVRNARRDGNKHVEQMEKASELTEDEAKKAKDEIQKLTDKYEKQISDVLEAKTKEIEEV